MNKEELEGDIISVIIPAYNVKKYIVESVNSVINQEYKNLEIIIVDDGSNDGTEKICDDFLKIDKRIKVIHQKNMGLSGARNTGLDNAKGRYIAFLDSDDVYFKDMIKKLYYNIKNLNADCVVCEYIYVRTSKKINVQKYKNNEKIMPVIYENDEILKAFVNRKIKQAVWNKLYKASLWDDVRFPVGHVYEDIVTSYRIMEKIKKICVLNDNYIIRRVHNDSITNTFTFKNLEDLYIAQNEYEKCVSNKVYDKKLYLYVCKKSYFNYISYYLKTSCTNSSEKEKINSFILDILSNYKGIVDKKEFSISEKIINYLFFNCRPLLIVLYKLKYIKNSIFFH